MNEASRLPVAERPCAAGAQEPPLAPWYGPYLRGQDPPPLPPALPDGHRPTYTELRALAESACSGGDLETARRDIADAIDGFTRAGDEWGMADALAVQGSIARAAGQIEVAARSYRESLSAFTVLGDFPSAMRQYAALGEALFAAGDYAGAAAWQLEALALLPGDPVLLTGLGYASWYQGQLADALTYLTEALSADSDNRPALSARGQVRADLGDAAPALDDLDHAHALHASDAAPDEPDLRSARALALAQLGRRIEAGAELSEALELDPRGARTQWRVARIRLRDGDIAGARDALRDALAGTPALPPAHAVEVAGLLDQLSPSASRTTSDD